VIDRGVADTIKAREKATVLSCGGGRVQRRRLILFRTRAEGKVKRMSHPSLGLMGNPASTT